jgi:simple sugar transport system permease protein
MTTQIAPVTEPSAPAPATTPDAAPGAWGGRALAAGRLLAAVAGAMVIFAIFMAVKGANPFTAYRDMFSSTFSGGDAVGDILIKATPLILAGLAVAVPARAGLINVGGEGQLIIGGVAAMGVSLAVDGGMSGTLTLVLMCLAAAVAGALWAGLAGVLRMTAGINESVSTLLLNYVALNVMYYLIYDRWKDRAGSGQPATRALPPGERLSVIGSGRVHTGIVLAVVATVVVWAVFRYTSWGFRLRVVGGNAEAARRAGLRVGGLALGAMAVGGALAGLGGLTQLAGAEFKLRPGFLAGYGYVAFLASWLARHKPIGVAVAATVLAAIVIGGDSLQIDSKLPAASVNVLMALTLLIVFGFGRKKASA